MFYWINPISQIQTGSTLFGYFAYEPCECGCTNTTGWGFNFGVFGFRKDTTSVEEIVRRFAYFQLGDATPERYKNVDKDVACFLELERHRRAGKPEHSNKESK